LLILIAKIIVRIIRALLSSTIYNMVSGNYKVHEGNNCRALFVVFEVDIARVDVVEVKVVEGYVVVVEVDVDRVDVVEVKVVEGNSPSFRQVHFKIS